MMTCEKSPFPQSHILATTEGTPMTAMIKLSVMSCNILSYYVFIRGSTKNYLDFP